MAHDIPIDVGWFHPPTPPLGSPGIRPNKGAAFDGADSAAVPRGGGFQGAAGPVAFRGVDLWMVRFFGNIWKPPNFGRMKLDETSGKIWKPPNFDKFWMKLWWNIWTCNHWRFKGTKRSMRMTRPLFMAATFCNELSHQCCGNILFPWSFLNI